MSQNFLEQITDPHLKLLLRTLLDRIGSLETHAAQIGTVAPLKAALNANQQLVSNLKDPVAAGDAVPKRYLQHFVAEYVKQAVDQAKVDIAAQAPGNDIGGGTAPVPGTTINPPYAVNIDGYSVIIENSPDVSAWATTTTITAVTADTTGFAVTFAKQSGGGRWPDVTFTGPNSTLQYTLWILLRINGQWYGSGIIQFWFGRTSTGDDVTAPGDIAANWVYGTQWGPMQGYNPVAGERIGLMVTAGNARGIDQHTVAERSPIAWIYFPPQAPPATTYPPFAPAP